jgi:hypothetical protein
MGSELKHDASSIPPLAMGEVGLRSNPGEGLRPIDRPYPLTPTLSPWERGRTAAMFAHAFQFRGAVH